MKKLFLSLALLGGISFASTAAPRAPLAHHPRTGSRPVAAAPAAALITAPVAVKKITGELECITWMCKCDRIGVACGTNLGEMLQCINELECVICCPIA